MLKNLWRGMVYLGWEWCSWRLPRRLVYLAGSRMWGQAAQGLGRYGAEMTMVEVLMYWERLSGCDTEPHGGA